MVRLARIYALALVESARMHETEMIPQLIKRFLAYLDMRGHRKLLPHILYALDRVREEERRRGRFVLTVAKEEAIEKELENARNLLGRGERVREMNVVVDGTLIGGFTVETPSTFVDASYKRMLVQCYKRMLSHQN